jgi:hypothetical protein
LDTVERIDGFTFEGGDMQVLFANFELLDYELSAHVTNCVFDMRDNWTAPLPAPPIGPGVTTTISGPHFGIVMCKDWDEHIENAWLTGDRRRVCASAWRIHVDSARPGWRASSALR